MIRLAPQTVADLREVSLRFAPVVQAMVRGERRDQAVEVGDVRVPVRGGFKIVPVRLVWNDPARKDVKGSYHPFSQRLTIYIEPFAIESTARSGVVQTDKVFAAMGSAAAHELEHARDYLNNPAKAILSSFPNSGKVVEAIYPKILGLKAGKRSDLFRLREGESYEAHARKILKRVLRAGDFEPIVLEFGLRQDQLAALIYYTLVYTADALYGLQEAKEDDVDEWNRKGWERQKQYYGKRAELVATRHNVLQEVEDLIEKGACGHAGEFRKGGRSATACVENLITRRSRTYSHIARQGTDEACRFILREVGKAIAAKYFNRN